MWISVRVLKSDLKQFLERHAQPVGRFRTLQPAILRQAGPFKPDRSEHEASAFVLIGGVKQIAGANLK